MKTEPGIEELLRIVTGLVGEIRPGRAPVAKAGSHLERDLGLDSLARAELLLRIERNYAARLPESTLAEAETPADLWRALQSAAVSADTHRRTAGSGPIDAAVAPLAGEPPDSETPFVAPQDASTLVEMLLRLAEHHPERNHVRFLQAEQLAETLSYGQLAHQAETLARGLMRQGLKPGMSVAVMLPGGPDFFRAFFGILMAGGVPAPLYPPARATQIEEHLIRQAGILESCQAVFLLVSPEVRLPGRLLQARVAGLAHVVTIAELVQGEPPARDLPPVCAADTAFLQYTSGSTGDPKGVVLSHANLLANIRAWSAATALRSEDVCVSWLPLYHDMGLIGAWLGSLYNGMPLVLMSPLDFLARPQRWLWAIHNYRGSITAAPNFAYELCARRIPDEELVGLDLSSWRLAANGAEPVNPDTLSRFCERFAPFGFNPAAMTPVYGLAECTVGLAVPPPGRGARIDRVDRERLQQGIAAPSTLADAQAVPGCGMPLPGHRIRIADDGGEPLPERHVGHLEFGGPSATSGYFRNPEATRDLFRNGDDADGVRRTWLDSGDLAYLADGEVFLTGRVKDTMIRAGRNLYPYELEAAIGALPGVRRGCVAVFGVADARGGSERLVAVVETRAGADAEEQRRAIDVLGMQILGEPLDDVVLEPPHTVLKTSSGKIRRAAIRAHYLAGTLAAASHAPAWQVVRLLAGAVAARLRGGLRSASANCYAAWAWGLFAVLTPWVWIGVVIGRKRVGWHLARGAARLLLRLAGGGPRVSGMANLPLHGPCVLVANHASYLDSVVLLAALPRLPVFVAKGELLGNFFARTFLAALDTEFVERFDARQGVADARRLAARVSAGDCLMFFPEGTFFRPPGLLPFRLGAFQAAVEAQAALLPVAITGTRKALPDGTWRPRRHPIAIIIDTPLRPSGTDWDASLALRDAARARLLQLTGEPDAEEGA
ncbi:MAG: acyl-phosphate glycerol 3-phosphate acyltransferase [Rhodocyclaceae bacterium]|nr:MAG: acyl-phosphate glycerol 3-phosphate acyltransferase [Rhodocyclaceae bacterium]